MPKRNSPFGPKDRAFARRLARNLLWFGVLGLSALALHHGAAWLEAHSDPAMGAHLHAAARLLSTCDLLWFASRLVVEALEIVGNTCLEVHRRFQKLGDARKNR